MKLIKDIENIVNSAEPGGRVATFHQQILCHAKTLVKNGIGGRKFIDTATSFRPSYITEYNKMIKLSGYLTLNHCDLCQKMVNLSHDTWDRIKFVRNSTLPQKVRETTITENLLFELAKFSESCTFKQVEAFEAVNEAVNGNDIEFFIQQPTGKYIFIPMQAKALYPSNKYEQIPYKNQNTYLLNYAKKTHGFPLYLLYNYSSTNLSYKNFGCSIVDANYIKKNFSSLPSPTFDDLHITNNVASPWYVLVCDSLEEKTNKSITRDLLDNHLDIVETYDYNNFFDKNKWEKINLQETYFEDRFNSEGKKIVDNDSDDFLPKYRIVISNINLDLEHPHQKD